MTEDREYIQEKLLGAVYDQYMSDEWQADGFNVIPKFAVYTILSEYKNGAGGQIAGIRHAQTLDKLITIIQGHLDKLSDQEKWGHISLQIDTNNFGNITVVFRTDLKNSSYMYALKLAEDGVDKDDRRYKDDGIMTEDGWTDLGFGNLTTAQFEKELDKLNMDELTLISSPSNTDLEVQCRSHTPTPWLTYTTSRHFDMQALATVGGTVVNDSDTEPIQSLKGVSFATRQKLLSLILRYSHTPIDERNYSIWSELREEDLLDRGERYLADTSIKFEFTLNERTQINQYILQEVNTATFDPNQLQTNGITTFSVHETEADLNELAEGIFYYSFRYVGAERDIDYFGFTKETFMPVLKEYLKEEYPSTIRVLPSKEKSTRKVVK